jgi:hypothetical protein
MVQDDDTRAEERRRHALLARVEEQAARWLDAARRCDERIGELASDDPTRHAQIISWESANRDRHMRNAADALRHAAEIRSELRLAPPLLLQAARLADA